MNRNFALRVYPGEYPRPSVEIIPMEQENLFIAATPWGSKDALKEMAETMRDFFATPADGEATSPFPQLPHLTPLGNRVRQATMFSNDCVYRKCNQQEYTSACEALVIAFNKTEMTWVQVGQPHLLLLRQNQIQPLQMALDLSVDYVNPTPLPGRLIGIDRQLDLEVKTLNLRVGDRLVMLARSEIPGSVFSLNLGGENNQGIAQKVFDALIQTDSKIPFWVGVCDQK